MKVLQCGTCGTIYSKTEIELAKVCLIGYRPGSSDSQCIKCVAIDRFGTPKSLFLSGKIKWEDFPALKKE